MKKNKKVLSTVLAAAIFAAGGCSASVEGLLSPPKLDEEQSAIYEALKNSMGGDIHLKYPKSGQYRSAFVVRNIDDEETEEAIVFYEASNVSDGGSSLRLNFLDMEDGQWVSVYDFAALGSEVERVQFDDLGNGETSIIITYTIQNSSDSATSVLRYKDGVPTEVYKSRHMYMRLLDLNDDGTDEMFLINGDRTSGTAAAYLLGWIEPNSFAVISSAPLSGSFSSCKNVLLGQCDTDGYRAIFIDYALSDGTFGTDALVCYDRRISAVGGLSELITRRTNSYTPNVCSQDIDGDGIIEIPATAVFPGYEYLTRNEQMNMTAWYRLEGQGYSVRLDCLSYISMRGDYVLFIPTRWEGRITASVSISDGTVSFSEYDSRKREAGKTLLTICSVPTGQAAPDGYTPYGSSEASGYSFYVKNNKSESFALTDAELADCFRILS